MPKSSKVCAAPGCKNVMHYGGAGMTPNAWAKRKYCSRKCGAACRSYTTDITEDGDVVSKVLFSFDLDDPFLRFISGWAMVDIKNRIGI